MSFITRRVDAKSRVVLPEQFAGRVVLIDAVSDSEVRVRFARSRRRPSLKALLAGISDDNIHEPVEFGRPVGEEQL
jgi:hypothetical protein